MGNDSNPKARSRHVFISYALADRRIALEITDAIKNAGLKVWIDHWELRGGDSIADKINTALSSNDILLVLLSPRSLASKWVEQELNTALSMELRDRAITVIPALIEDCLVPPFLADRAFLDLRKDFPQSIQRLVEQIATSSELDFSRLNTREFEKMVADLLVVLGFNIEPKDQLSDHRDSGSDIVATFRARDPFGAEKVEKWLVEAKLYSAGRVSVETLSKLAGKTLESKTSKALVVTNSRLTSVAREYLASLRGPFGNEVRVIDGTELTSLLIKHPEITRVHFPPTPVP